MMEFEADRMSGLVLDDAVVAPERDVVLEERRMRVETDPSAQLSEAMAAGLFVHHPYGIPIIGWMHEIEGPNREHALAYYKRFYTPENAILVVAGDVTPTRSAGSPRPPTARRAAGRAARAPAGAGAGAEGAPPRRDRRPEGRAADPAAALSHALLHHRPRRRLPRPRAARRGAGRRADLVLYRKLVMETGLAVNAGAWYMGSAIDETRFSVYAVPAEGVSLEKLEEAVDRVLRRALAEALDAEAIERAKTRLVAETSTRPTASRRSPASTARRWRSARPSRRSARWPADIEAVSRERLRGRRRALADAGPSVTGYLDQGGP